MDKGNNSSGFLCFASHFARQLGLIMMLSIAGCATLPYTYPDYPPSFPKLASPTGPCPVFAGLYLNKGVRYNPATGLEAPAVLTRDVLVLGDMFDDSDVIRISIDVKPFSYIEVGVLRVESTSGHKWEAPREKSAHCYKGGITYPIEGGGGATPAFAAFEIEAARFVVGGDGSLIVRHLKSTKGIALPFIPFWWTSFSYYYRFPPVTDGVPSPR